MPVQVEKDLCKVFVDEKCFIHRHITQECHGRVRGVWIHLAPIRAAVRYLLPKFVQSFDVGRPPSWVVSPWRPDRVRNTAALFAIIALITRQRAARDARAVQEGVVGVIHHLHVFQRCLPAVLQHGILLVRILAVERIPVRQQRHDRNLAACVLVCNFAKCAAANGDRSAIVAEPYTVERAARNRQRAVVKPGTRMR